MIQKRQQNRGFSITRIHSAEGSYDPCAGIEWRPSRDSDELFEVLKRAYPGRKTHRGRMQEALVEFLAGELEGKDEGKAGAQVEELKMAKKPVFRTVVSPPRQPVETKSKEEGSAKTVGKAKEWEDMTVVWRSDVGLTKGARPRRMMTEEERTDYRMRRVRGACVSCKRKKRKCNHDSGPSPSTSLETIHTPDTSVNSEESKEISATKSSLSNKFQYQDSPVSTLQASGTANLPPQPKRSALRNGQSNKLANNSEANSLNCPSLNESSSLGLSSNKSSNTQLETSLAAKTIEELAAFSPWTQTQNFDTTAFENTSAHVWWNCLDQDSGLYTSPDNAMLQTAGFSSSYAVPGSDNSLTKDWPSSFSNSFATTNADHPHHWLNDTPPLPLHHPQSKISPAPLIDNSTPTDLFVSLSQLTAPQSTTTTPPSLPYHNTTTTTTTTLHHHTTAKESEVLHWLHQKLLDETCLPQNPELQLDLLLLPPFHDEAPQLSGTKKPGKGVKFDFSSLIDGPPTLAPSSHASPLRQYSGMGEEEGAVVVAAAAAAAARAGRSSSRHSMSSRGDGGGMDVMSLSSALTSLSVKDGGGGAGAGWSSRRTSIYWDDDEEEEDGEDGEERAGREGDKVVGGEAKGGGDEGDNMATFAGREDLLLGRHPRANK